jgi:nucleoside-diphosphate-sugar epimerase
MSRSVLVTGGAGYLGSVLVPMLLAHGDRVTVVDLFTYGTDALGAVAGDPRLVLRRADITEPDLLPALLGGIDAVVHLAGIANDATCALDPTLTVTTNHAAVLRLARQASREGVRTFVFASSCAIFGDTGGRAVDEDAPATPVSLYARTKLTTERELLPMAASGFSPVSLRFATLFGLSPRMRLDLAVNYLTACAAGGRPLVMHGGGRQYRPFLHVRDAARAILLALDAAPGAVSGQLFNVGGQALNVTIREVTDRVRRRFPDAEIRRAPPADPLVSYHVDVRKIEATLGFAPRLGLDHGIDEIGSAFQRGALGPIDEARYYNLATMRQTASPAGSSPLERP